jgi:hypothetical protein
MPKKRTTTVADPAIHVQEGFQKALNEHGAGFQYAILAELQRLHDPPVGDSPWRFLAAELPVEAHGHSTRADIVLAQHGLPNFMVVECKRANPAIANWCFFRSPEVAAGISNATFVAQAVNRFNEHQVRPSTVTLLAKPHYHWALEVDTREAGDRQG